MSKKYFKDLDDCEKCIIVQMCEDIENRDIVFISTDKRFKVMGKNRSFMSDWTYTVGVLRESQEIAIFTHNNIRIAQIST